MFEEIEKKVADKEKFVTEQSERLKEMDDSYNTLKDYLEVLKKAQQLNISGSGGASFNDNEMGGINRGSHHSEDPRNPLIQGDSDLKFSHVAGVIESDEKQRMKKLLFRATKGTTLVIFSDFDEPVKDSSGKEVLKSAYFVTFQDVPHIRSRVIRICESFNGQRFDLPQAEFLHAKINETKGSLEQAAQLRKDSRGQLRKYLEQVNDMNASDAHIVKVS